MEFWSSINRQTDKRRLKLINKKAGLFLSERLILDGIWENLKQLIENWIWGKFYD